MCFVLFCFVVCLFLQYIACGLDSVTWGWYLARSWNPFPPQPYPFEAAKGHKCQRTRPGKGILRITGLIFGLYQSINFKSWKHELIQPLWKTVWSFFKKLKIELPYDHMIQQFHSWYISEENENTNLKRYMHPSVHSNVTYNSNLSVHQQMNRKRRCGVYISNEILLSHKKE